ncbi:MAG TPA: VTT domain-containing protein [Terracidiphilus sp.]|nr:VTT domain-containing protein [Terracidiphilus sp.]
MALWISLAGQGGAPVGKRNATFHWLVHLGAPGVFVISFIDASIIPLAIPGSTDLLLLWLISHRSSPWIIVPCALVGSVLGGWTTWRLGQKGGEKAIERYVPPRLKNRMHGWSQRHPLLMVFLPAILPPPIPLWPFLLAAGALGASWKRFLTAFGGGRALRYGFEGWLGITYGRRVIHLWSKTLDKWQPAILWAFVILTLAGAAFSVWKLRRDARHPRGGRAVQPSHAN